MAKETGRREAGGSGGAVGPAPSAPIWILIVGCVALGLGILFLMGLIVAAVLGAEIPDGSRMLVVFLLALLLSFGSAFLGGWATAGGKIPLPGAQRHPLAYSVGGGIAVFVIVLLLGYWVYGKNGATPRVGIDSVMQSGDAATSLVNVGYTLTNFRNEMKLDYEVRDPIASPAPMLASGRLETPQDEKAAIRLRRASDRPVLVELIIKGADGRVVARSGPVESTLSQPGG